MLTERQLAVLPASPLTNRVATALSVTSAVGCDASQPRLRADVRPRSVQGPALRGSCSPRPASPRTRCRGGSRVVGPSLPPLLPPAAHFPAKPAHGLLAPLPPPAALVALAHPWLLAPDAPVAFRRGLEVVLEPPDVLFVIDRRDGDRDAVVGPDAPALLDGALERRPRHAAVNPRGLTVSSAPFTARQREAVDRQGQPDAALAARLLWRQRPFLLTGRSCLFVPSSQS